MSTPRASLKAEIEAIQVELRRGDEFGRCGSLCEVHPETQWTCAFCLYRVFDRVLTLLDAEPEPQFIVSEIRQGEENDGPLESTDGFLDARGISLLVNVPAGSSATFSLSVDGQHKSAGLLGLAERCSKCGASKTSELTARNIPGYPACSDCGAVTSIRTLTEPEQGWQDISTAPENTRVLVYSPEEGDFIGGTFAGILIPFTGRWVIAGGGGTLPTPPTMWMPLPAPPRPSSPAAEENADHINDYGADDGCR